MNTPTKTVTDELATGPEIRKLRLERGITMTALAAQFGIDLTYLSDMERGVRRMNADRFTAARAWILQQKKPTK